MFIPDGYVSFTDARSLFQKARYHFEPDLRSFLVRDLADWKCRQDWLDDWETEVPEDPNAVAKRELENPESEVWAFANENIQEEDIQDFLDFAFSDFLEGVPVCLAKQELGTMQISVSELRLKELLRYQIPPQRVENALWGKGKRRLSDKPSYFDFDTGTFLPSNVLDLAQAAHTLLLHDFFLGNEQSKKLQELVQESARAESLMKWNGASIVIKSEDLPSIKQIKVILDQRAKHYSEEVENAGVNLGGRPSKKEDAIEAYQQCFPFGHANARWKEVLRTMEANTGVRVGIDTLKRALAETGEF